MRDFLKEHKKVLLGGLALLFTIIFLTPFVKSFSEFRTFVRLIEDPNSHYTIDQNSTSTDELNTESIPQITFENISDDSFFPTPKGKIIRINLFTMQLKQYENGELIGEKKILSKGKKGSIWETPGGNYIVSNKEEDYFSERADAWLPFNIELYGNYFIHGIPHNTQGRNYNTSFNAGCIRLSNEDASDLFTWADGETRVSIYSDSTLKPEPISTESVYITQDGTVRPNVSAEAYIVADIDTGEIILQKNKDAVFPIASVTKLMTAVVSLDTMNQFEYATVSKRAANIYGVSNLRPGEQIELSNLLNPLLLVSSNSSAEVIAEHKGRENFMEAMNKEARNLKMSSTSFEDPSGLSKNNTSTAYDLFLLAQHISKEKAFLWDITKRQTYSAQGHSWGNISQFLRDPNYVGGKGGSTYEAKLTHLGVWSLPLSDKTPRNIAVIVLRSNDRYTDVRNILSYLKSRVVYGKTGKFEIAEPKDKTHEVSIRFVGDVMLDRGVLYSVNKNYAGDFSKLFENLGSYKESDIFFANLEGPISDKGTDMRNLYSFRMNPSILPILKNTGLDIVSLANNHIGDWREDAFNDTRTRLAENGILYTGAGDNSDQSVMPTIIEKNGLKIGFIGFSDVGPNWLTATKEKSGINILDEATFDTIVKNAKAQVDVLTVSLHWGIEYSNHTDRQTDFAHRAVDNGATLVIGHHPHVIQDVEIYRGGLIAYSLGNFIFDQGFSKETMEGLTLEVVLDTDEKYIKRYKTYKTIQDSTFRPNTPVSVSLE